MTWPELRPCEELLTDPHEQWYRSAVPDGKYVDDGEISPEVFVASSSDEGKISGARGHLQTPRGLREYRERSKPVGGVWGVSVAEVDAAGARLIDDSQCDDGFEKVLGHTYLDARGLGPKARRDMRESLAYYANKRAQLA